MSLVDGEVDTEFWDDRSGGGRPESASARVFLGVGVVAIAIVGAFAGLAAAGLTGGKRTQEIATPAATAAPDTSTARTLVVGDTSSTEPATTSVTIEPTSSSSSSSTSPSPSPSSTATSSSSTTPTTRPTTTRPTTTVTVPQTVVNTSITYPAAINVAYSQDSAGALVVPKFGRALIELTNTGGEPGQWVFTVSAGGYRLSQTTGELAPGATVSITVTEVQGTSHSGTIGLLVAPGDRYSIPLRTP